jgi:hypothetical protein
LIATMLCALLVNGGAGLEAARAATDDEVIGVTQPARVTHEVDHPTRAYQSPFMLPHPEDPTTTVAAGTEMSASRCHLFRSQTRGRSWTLMDASPSPKDQPLCFEGAVYAYQNETPMAWGRDGDLYWPVSGRNPDNLSQDVSVLLAQSSDLGESWSTTTVDDGLATGEFEFISRPITGLAVDTQSGAEDIVYVGWHTFPEGQPREPQIAVSTDGGVTFSEPMRPFDDETSQQLGGSEGLEGLPPKIEVDADGTLYVLFPGRAAGDESVDEVPNRLLLARSEDRGETFTVTELAEVLDSNVGPELEWTPQGGEDGTLHIVYEDRLELPYGVRDIIYQRSTDGGETFTDPRTLNDDDPEQLYSQVNPNISIAPNGRVDVAWWDWRDGAARYANDVYYTHSDDGGDSWSTNIRVSDQSIGRRIGYWGNNADMRSRPGIASTNAVAQLGWSDTRLASAGTGTQDIFFAQVQHDEVASADTNATLLYVAAAVAGLLLGGLGLLGVVLVLRRRRIGGGVAQPAG